MALTNKKRLDLIESWLREHKYADLHTLAREFNASLSTVRRALNDLEAAGTVRRHHGGASLVEEANGGSYDFITQDDTNAEEKRRIAQAVASRIQDGMTLMVDSGTTTYTVTKHLLGKRLTYITNSLPIAALLNEVSSSETIVTGGNLYNRLGVLCGPACESALSNMHADVALMGCAGITKEGIWNNNALLSSYQQRMISACSKVIFVADGSKIGRRSLVLTAAMRPEYLIATNACDALHQLRAELGDQAPTFITA